MFRRKLNALRYIEADKFDINDERQVRCAVLWLEEQKLRHLGVTSRDRLRQLGADSWPAEFQQYLRQLSCPLSADNRAGCFDWLLTRAVTLEYEDNLKKYQNFNYATNSSTNGSKSHSDNPLEQLNYECDAFATGVAQLARIVGVACHRDPQVTLQAACHVIRARLAAKNDTSEAKSNAKIQGVRLSLDEVPSGVSDKDLVLQDAVKILRLLYIRDLRALQTEVNELIVAVQTLLADPRTDTRIGAKGR